MRRSANAYAASRHLLVGRDIAASSQGVDINPPGVGIAAVVATPVRAGPTAVKYPVDTATLRLMESATVTGRLHDDEIPMDLPLVRALVDRALPACAGLALRQLGSSGSSNALFRLGDELLVRLPRQPGGSTTIEKEARWLPRIGPLLPVSVPEIVAIGEPCLGYPERWSVVRWIPGDVPLVVGPETPVDPARRGLAQDLAGVIAALGHIDVPSAALRDPALRWYRGEPLARRDAHVRAGIEACRAIPGLALDLDAAVRVWDEAMSLPGIDRAVPPRWYHGDLLAENLVVRDGRLAAVLDSEAWPWATQPSTSSPRGRCSTPPLARSSADLATSVKRRGCGQELGHSR